MIRAPHPGRYLVALTLDAAGTTAFALTALPSDSPALIVVAALAVAGLGLAALALAVLTDGSRSGAVRPLLVAGLVLTSTGCPAVLAAQGGSGHPLVTVAALALLVIGDALSAVYLTALGGTRSRREPYAS